MSERCWRCKGDGCLMEVDPATGEEIQVVCKVCDGLGRLPEYMGSKYDDTRI